MDKGKVRGDYASAYKLSGSRSTVDKKTLRIHRRSVEQRELRHEAHNKRRPLVDLSPVHEGDQSNVNKHYKDKTPVKTRGDKSHKGYERLEQLMKWKKEREMKKKMEAQSKNSNPVFKVRAMSYSKDTDLFNKTKGKPPAQTKKPVAPAPPPVAPSTKMVKKPQQPAATSRSKPAPSTTTRQATSKKAPGNQSHPMRKPVTEPVPVRSRRQTSPVKKQKPAPAPARNTRQSSRSKATTEKSTKAASTVTKDPAPDTQRLGSADFSRVTRERGPSSTDSFAPPDFSFNVSSYVFKPLSPNSAAGFLYPGQDNSCASFLETNPKRASTPKKDKDSQGSPKAVAKVTDKCSDTIMLDNTAINMKGEPQQDVKPAARRSTRQSRSSVPRESRKAEKKDKTVEKAEDTTILAAETANSSTRRSTRQASRRTTRSSQRSVNESVQELNSTVVSNNDSGVDLGPSKDTSGKQRRTRSRTRRSESHADKTIEGGAKTEQATTSEPDTEATTASQSQRESPKITIDQKPAPMQENLSQDNSAESSADEVFMKTPLETRHRGSVRRSIRLSTATGETPDQTASLRKVDTPKSVLKKDSSKSVKKVKHVTLSIDIDDEQENQDPEEEETLRRSGRHARRSMPSAGERKKVSKKNQRKSMLPRLPKSPEEWVEFLSNSPMVEMTRRTPKHNTSNLAVPPLNFDDVDLEQPNFEETEAASAVVQETDAPTASPSQASESRPIDAGASPVVQDSEPRPAEQASTGEAEEMETSEEAAVSTSDGAATSEQQHHEAEVLKAISPKAATATVQVEEVSSTQGPNEDSATEEHDVKYFRNLVTSETNRLNNQSSHWNEINANTSLTEDVHGQIRTTIGQAQLLIAQRFKQFIGLVDNCEFKRGEKETTCTDLQGFWDMVYFQVEDVDDKFRRLAKLQSNNWAEDKPKEVKKTKKKVAKPAVVKPVVKSKFAAFRAQMKKKAGSPTPPAVVEEKVFEIPGFFKVASPVRTPKYHCEAGTPKKATPAESKFTSDENTAPGSNTLNAPSSGSDNPLQRLYARKSYVPIVPSPLLQDTTPVARPSRTCTLPRPAVAPETGDEMSIARDSETGESASKRIKTTPVRRSLRPRKSVNLMEENPDEMGSPKLSDSLPCTEPQSPSVDDELNISQESFSKYLQPSFNSSNESGRKSTGRRASLKACPSSERRKSRRSVHFAASPGKEDEEQVKHMKMPRTPFNRNSIVKQKRVTRRSVSEVEDIFSIDTIDNDENTPPAPATFRSPRPSLLFTPPEKKKTPPVNTNVPTATLISFTP